MGLEVSGDRPFDLVVRLHVIVLYTKVIWCVELILYDEEYPMDTTLRKLRVFDFPSFMIG